MEALCGFREKQIWRMLPFISVSMASSIIGKYEVTAKQKPEMATA